MTALYSKLFRRSKKTPTKSRHLREKRVEAKSTFLQKSRRLTALILFSTTAALILISFWGQAPSGPRVSIGQVARTRVIAEFPFPYISKIQTEAERDRIRKQVPPVYRVDYKHFSDFEVFINELNDLIFDFSRTNRKLPRDQQEAKLEEELNTYIANSEFKLDVNSLLTLYRETDFRGRYRLLSQGLTVLWNIYREGIFSPVSAQDDVNSRFSLIKITNEQGDTREVRFKKPTEALLDLRVGLSELEKSEIVYQALFEIMKEGIKVNLYYNETDHNKEIQAALAKVEPVQVDVETGDTIIELGSIVTERDMEKLNAYEEKRRTEAKSESLMGQFMRERVFYTFIILSIVVIFIAITYQRQERTNRNYSLSALMIVLNMIVIRMVLELGESTLFSEANSFTSLLIYAPPFLLAPIVINILLGIIPAMLAAVVLSTFYSMMQGNSIEMFLFIMLTCMVGITMSHRVRVRSKIVRATFFAGLTLASIVIIQGLFEGLSVPVIIQRTLLIVILSLVYGMLIVGIVPILESVFKISSDITLLELTDYNHPLLRRMQLEAPGTYHHSLMVANIAEKAAIEIGANPLVCRTCALFHDIGKMSKPEYFTENQTVGSVSPHDSMKPSMSALVIKNHVSEGVELGRKYSLPQVVIDVIRQHHGTSLIRYFYFQAVNEAKKNAKKSDDASKIDVDQSNYRYDGPSPLFKESAILFLADSVEAASRSLKKVNQQNIEDLIDGIVANAQGDHQLDQAPLSYQELAKIRSSFIMSILNMLHSRIEYPKPNEEPAKKDSEPKPESELVQSTSEDAAGN